MKPRYFFIALIGIAIVILFLPTVISPTGGGRTIGVCTAFEVAVNNFESEYNYLPYGASMNDPKQDLHIRSDSDLMVVLTGKEEEINFKQIKFFEMDEPRGTDPSNYRDGIHVDGSKVTLYDQWGKLYYIIIDYDGDGQIQHPFRKGEVITGKKVVIYSAGPDGEVGSESKDHDNPNNFE